MTENKLEFPLPVTIINFIKEDQKDYADFVVNSIECTIKDSNNHYEDLLISLDPLLGEKTAPFLQKLFMYKKRECRLGEACDQPNCLFLHNSNVSANVNNFSLNKDLNYKEVLNKETISRSENREVVYNKIDEIKFGIGDITEYASKFGTVESVRRLNRGKYLIIYQNALAAQKQIESQEAVLADPGIKKFYNKLLRTDPSPSTSGVATINRRFDIVELLQEQKDFVEQIEKTGDISNIALLKLVTLRIRNYILQKENRTLNSTQSFKGAPVKKAKLEENESESIYSTYFK